MSDTGWEQNSQLVLQKLSDLAATDAKIIDHISDCRAKVIRLQTLVGVFIAVTGFGLPILLDSLHGYSFELDRVEAKSLDHVNRVAVSVRQIEKEVSSTAATLDKHVDSDTMRWANNNTSHHSEFALLKQRLDSVESRLSIYNRK